MLVRDPFSGALHEVPHLSEYDVGEVVYDRLGHPVALAPPGLAFDDGFGNALGLPFLAPLLPVIAGAAKAVIPMVAKALPSLLSTLGPQSGPIPAPAATATPAAPAFAPMAPAPPAQGLSPGPVAVVPGPGGPLIIRRFRRRRPHAR